MQLGAAVLLFEATAHVQLDGYASRQDVVCSHTVVTIVRTLASKLVDVIGCSNIIVPSVERRIQ